MANFNTQEEAVTIDELATYGYTHLETSSPDEPLLMYFADDFGAILKLSVDTTSHATVYINDIDKTYREQIEVLAESVVTDLQSLDDLLIPVYSTVDSVLIKVENLTSISEDREVLTPTITTYYTATEFTDSAGGIYNVSEEPSPYRDTPVTWVPITFLDPNWVLTYNTSVIVNTTKKVTNAYGDFIVLKP